MSTHTPGPWKEYVSPENRWIGNADTGEIVCDRPHVNYRDDRLDVRWKANARLLAAAPAMLEALKAALQAIDAMPPAYAAFPYVSSRKFEIEKAIRLAEGRG